MAKVKDVMVKYHKVVPFPWTVRKIKKAGKEVTPFLLELGQELAGCDDADSEAAKQLLSTLRELEMLL